MSGKVFLILVCAAALILSGISHAETTCSVSGCDITITIKMAFAGANASYASNAENEVETFWNGPRGFRTTGECKCTIEVKLETKLVADCNNPPQGYHCITVTNFFKPDGTYDNPPRNQTNITGAAIYVGYVNAVASGNGSNSQGGWFSDIMSRPVNSANPAGPHYMDFAHEAGHLMGLPHSNNTSSIMNNTLVTAPTQADLDGIVDNICGQNACPDSCCCGNGVVEGGRGENCDPQAKPNGCAADAFCCPVCCSCYKPICLPSAGEYPDDASCKSACGAGSACYMNYKTGCWNCVKQEVVVTGSCLDGSKIRGNMQCDHIDRSLSTDDLRSYQDSLADTPFLGGLFMNERVNIVTEEGDAGHIVTADGQITQCELSLLSDPTVIVMTDRDTVERVSGGEMTMQQALSSGRVSINGGDILNGIRFGFYHLAFDIFNFFNPADEYVATEPMPAYSKDYIETMGQLSGEEEPAPVTGIGRVPDAPWANSE